MNKTAKKIILGITIPAAIAGAIAGGLLIYRNVNVKPVPVYPIGQLAMTDLEGDMNTTYGTVSSEGLQKVFLSGTQTVKSVDVKEGQEVKKGDVILTYDTSLTDIEVERARVKMGRLELELEQAKKELDDLNNAQPHTTQIIEPGYTVEYKPSETPKLLRGSGTSEDPYIYLFDEDDSITGSLLNDLLKKAGEGDARKDKEKKDTESGTESTDQTDNGNSDDTAPDDTQDVSGADDSGSVYVIIINRENNALNAKITAKRGLRIDVSEGVVKGLGFFEPYIPGDIEQYEEQPQPHEEESGSEYTQEELVQLRSQKAEEIKEIRRNAALAKNEYEQKKLEVSDGVVRASEDGVVKKVRTPQEAESENVPVVELSAGGAYYVVGTISEFDLETVHKGDIVTVNTYGMNDGEGGTYEGEVIEISDKPATGDESFSYFGSGEENTNATYYPFKIQLSGEPDLKDDSYIEIYYDPTGSKESGIYITSAFIKREGADTFIYVKGESGLLEKRSVKTGKSLWGAYTQIKSGLRSEDKLAFPYGKDVKEGARTTDGNIEDIYSDMSGL